MVERCKNNIINTKKKEGTWKLRNRKRREREKNIEKMSKITIWALLSLSVFSLSLSLSHSAVLCRVLEGSVLFHLATLTPQTFSEPLNSRIFQKKPAKNREIIYTFCIVIVSQKKWNKLYLNRYEDITFSLIWSEALKNNFFT